MLENVILGERIGLSSVIVTQLHMDKEKKIYEYIEKNSLLKEFYLKNRTLMAINAPLEDLYPPLYLGEVSEEVHLLPSPQRKFFYIYTKEDRENSLRLPYEEFLSNLRFWEVSLQPYWYKKDES